MKADRARLNVTGGLLCLLVGFAIGGAVVYTCVAMRCQRRYEAQALRFVEIQLSYARRLRTSETQTVINQYDLFLGRYPLMIQKELHHVTGANHVLWAIKKYFREYNLATDARLESLFKQVSDQEPNETTSMLPTE